MESPIDRLAYADCAFVEAELRAKERGEQLPSPTPAAGATCPSCGRRNDEPTAPRQAPVSTEEIDALHFRFWSADHKQFDHIGFAHAVLAACARDAGRAPRDP